MSAENNPPSGEQVVVQTAMMSVQDDRTDKLYIQRLDSIAEQKAEFAIQRLPRLSSPRLIVDFGCLTGTVAATIKQRCPLDAVEGIDINAKYIDQANAAYGSLGVRYAAKGASEKLPYADNKVSAFLALSVLHEVYSYHNFQVEPVVDLLRDMHRMLMPQGRVIIREPVKPDNPNEFLHVTLDATVGADPQEVAGLLQALPSELSQAALMRRFILQFEPLQNSPVAEQAIQADKNQFILPAWVVSEFFRKRKNAVYPEFFESEMKEQTNAFTADELKLLAHQAGFEEGKIDVTSTFERGFFAAVEAGVLTMQDESGVMIRQEKRFPSHLHGVLIKG